ncbi:MAG: hypothetical protein ACREX8_09115, partial [Gammaproteobacteria bacterium]
HRAVLPAVGEDDDPPVWDELDETSDDGRAVGVGPLQLTTRDGSAPAPGPTQRTSPAAVVRCSQTTSTGAVHRR